MFRTFFQQILVIWTPTIFILSFFYDLWWWNTSVQCKKWTLRSINFSLYIIIVHYVSSDTNCYRVSPTFSTFFMCNLIMFFRVFISGFFLTIYVIIVFDFEIRKTKILFSFDVFVSHLQNKYMASRNIA